MQTKLTEFDMWFKQCPCCGAQGVKLYDKADRRQCQLNGKNLTKNRHLSSVGEFRFNICDVTLSCDARRENRIRARRRNMCESRRVIRGEKAYRIVKFFILFAERMNATQESKKAKNDWLRHWIRMWRKGTENIFYNKLLSQKNEAWESAENEANLNLEAHFCVLD